MIARTIQLQNKRLGGSGKKGEIKKERGGPKVRSSNAFPRISQAHSVHFVCTRKHDTQVRTGRPQKPESAPNPNSEQQGPVRTRRGSPTKRPQDPHTANGDERSGRTRTTRGAEALSRRTGSAESVDLRTRTTSQESEAVDSEQNTTRRNRSPQQQVACVVRGTTRGAALCANKLPLWD